MLTLLQIENVATIEKLTVSFSGGLNILTGETGAGKSILIDSINAVLGAKTSRDLIRSGESVASVSAFFSELSPIISKKIEEMGLPAEADGTLNLRRRLYKDGKNACFINGAAVTVSMLKAVAFELINIHGQRDAQALLQSDRHLDFLDEFADNEALRSAYTDAYSRCKTIKAELQSLQMDDAFKARRMDLLNYQIAELTAADIKEGETEELRRQKALIGNSEKVRSALEEAVSALLGNEDAAGADTLMGEAIRCIRRASDIASGLGPVAQSLEEAKETVLDASAVLDDALSQLSGGMLEMETIEERLDLLYRLSRKYGATENEMLQFLKDAQAELDTITFAEEKSLELQAALEKEKKQLTLRAEALTDSRKKAARLLSNAVSEELKFLDMPNVRFITALSPANYTERGADAAVFLLSANVGEEPKPLEKVASGGELSRVMLALKNVLRGEGASTLIFDEIDAGVSGSAAGKIAQKLSMLASAYQVLCVTHSAQIAAFADAHLQISKSVHDQKTYTAIRTLSEEEQVFELARITFGPTPSETQLNSAKQMILQADSLKSRIKS